MAVLYVDEYGAKIRWEAGLVVVEKEGVQLAAVRVQELEGVVITENSSITSAALSAFLRWGVDAAFVSSGGEYLGKLEPVPCKNVFLRKEQYAAAGD